MTSIPDIETRIQEKEKERAALCADYAIYKCAAINKLTIEIRKLKNKINQMRQKK
jgi:hypothetical protein